jgi:S1-C subfamily serine protease
MKSVFCVGFLFLCLAFSKQSPAQETNSETKSFQEIQTKAEKGAAQAQFELAQAYEMGRGVAKNEAEAVKWYRRAADKDYSPAEFMLACCLLNGSGVDKDEREAVLWLKKAAEKGHMMAQNDLGAFYAEGGPEIPKDLAKAVEWYRKSAEQGHYSAQFNLGVCYASGAGAPKDYVQAYKWFSLASAVGYTWDESTTKSAKNNLEIAEARMTPGQIAEAQRLAREFKPKKEAGSNDSVAPNIPTASGTGFFISPDGFLISNNHVVEGAGQVRLVTSTGLISAKVVKVDAANDLALLKAEGRFTPLPLSPSRGVKLGGTVATVGFPNIGLQGFAPKLAKGEIASLSGAGDDARYFQISVPVQPGNSGGALVDERGNVVGVVSAKLNASTALAMSGTLPENVNYAVKSSYLLSFLESVPDVASKLKEPATKEKKFEEVVKEAEQAAVLVLVY